MKTVDDVVTENPASEEQTESRRETPPTDENPEDKQEQPSPENPAKETKEEPEPEENNEDNENKEDQEENKEEENKPVEEATKQEEPAIEITPSMEEKAPTSEEHKIEKEKEQEREVEITKSHKKISLPPYIDYIAIYDLNQKTQLYVLACPDIPDEKLEKIEKDLLENLERSKDYPNDNDSVKELASEKMEQTWLINVNEKDLVLMSGLISAMQRAERQ